MSIDPSPVLADGSPPTGLVVSDRAVDPSLATRVDIACAAQSQLLVYGWIFGLGHAVSSVVIRFGKIIIDLAEVGVLVPRPDVTGHFAGGIASEDDLHGFYVLVDLPETVPVTQTVRLSVVSTAGVSTESDWPVSGTAEAIAGALAELDLTFAALSSRLPPAEAERLVTFAGAARPDAKPAWAVAGRLLAAADPASPEREEVPAEARGSLEAAGRMRPQGETAPATTASFPLKFAIDQCSVLRGQLLLLTGWLFDPDEAVTAFELVVDGLVFDLAALVIRITRPDVDAALAAEFIPEGTPAPGFVFAALLPDELPSPKVTLRIEAGGQVLELPQKVTTDAQGARDAFRLGLESVAADGAVSAVEVVRSQCAGIPDAAVLLRWLEALQRRALARLATFVDSVKPRYMLHVDGAIRVPGGVVLTGWHFAAAGARLAITCHCGRNKAALDEIWVRHARPDVTLQLEQAGISRGLEEHGFLAYLPIEDGDAPYHMTVTADADRKDRLRIGVPEPSDQTLATVRSLLTAFTTEHRQLRYLLDRHIGPAVTAVWSGRPRPPRQSVVHRFGQTPADPAVSIIVPLYGRHDLAEYQIALFADDPEFQLAQLIYVVDDPALYDEFRRISPGLYGMYGVPFAVAFPGVNLGFGGASNYGAELASGRLILLLNSDVFPKAPGWLGRLVEAYRARADTGLLGAKLLYEDGSLQHAGMEFRRHPPWGGLWINHHPFKGQSPLGLSGVKDVDTVTAACTLIDTALFRELGGFSDDYLVGDFEDSDLCLRALRAGRQNRVALDVELYHLERQSQGRVGDAQWRTNLTLYNCWLHDSRWGDLIAERRL